MWQVETDVEIVSPCMTAKGKLQGKLTWGFS
jgi:hypothetical protein